MSRWWLPVVGLFAVSMCPATASGQSSPPIVTSPVQTVVSQPLRNGHDDSSPGDRRVHTHGALPRRGGGSGTADEAAQTAPGASHSSRPGASFPGVSASGYAPPDTNMAVGPDYIVQTVNSRYAIYNKSGALLVGPYSLSSIWSALGTTSGCASNNGGDVVAQYDLVAKRYVITQLGGTSSPYSECIAVSQTSDPTGSYYLYEYSYGTTLNDYPKFGVWPTATNSAYLATYNLFSNGRTFAGGQLCAYDRTKMLAGDPTASSICYTIANDGGYLPSDLDGATPPLDGTPGYFLTYETLSSLRLYSLAPNFANPSASKLQQQSPDLPVSAFSEACATSGYTCVPQYNTSQKLDSLGDRLMYRLAFRNFGDHEAMVVNHSVTVGSSVGVRWYEVRAAVSTTATFSVYQQGSYAPDSTYRWMGSAAMDGAGNIGVGYSASSTAMHPAIRYAGRAPTDALGVLGVESSMIEGGGSQTSGLSRWGDYSAMRIDPADDCTFWYTNEYLAADGSFNWSTWFGSFRFASCGSSTTTADFSMSANPTSVTVTAGGSGSSNVTVTALNGFSGSVALAVTGCPANATCSIASPVSSGTYPLTISTTSTTPTGPYTLTVTGTSGNLVHSTAVALSVNAAPSDFGISASPTSLTVSRGASGQYTVSIAAVTGTAPVTLSVSGVPSRTSASFSPNPASSPGTSTLTIKVNRNAGPGIYSLRISGNNGSTTHATTVTLTIR